MHLSSNIQTYYCAKTFIHQHLIKYSYQLLFFSSSYQSSSHETVLFVTFRFFSVAHKYSIFKNERSEDTY